MQRLRLWLLTLLLCPALVPSAWAGVTRNADGFSDVTPSADSRVVYVSTAGNDANNGLSPQTSKHTVAAGYALLRSGYPDQLLLNRGDTFNEGTIFWNKNGRNTNEPILLGAYGSGARPVYMAGDNGAIKYSSNIAYTFVQSIEITTTDGNRWGGVGTVGGANSQTFEDCYIHNCSNNCAFLEGDDADRLNGIVFRRCVIADAWQTGGNGSRGQGFMLGHCNNFMVEECIVIGNGWQNGGQPRSTEAHNFYTYGVMDGLTIRDCIIANGSFLGISGNGNGQTFTGNLCVGNTVGIGVRPQNCVCENNVITETAWQAGFDSQAIDVRPLWTGTHADLNTPGAVSVRNNLVFNNPNVVGSTNGAIQYNSSNPANPSAVRNITGNVVHGWDGACMTIYSAGGGYDPVVATGNTLVANSSRAVVQFNPGSASGFTFSGNHYYRGDAGGQWFSGSANRTAAQWAAFTGESNATTTAPTFLDPSRTVSTYASSLGLSGSTAAFLADLRGERRGNWHANRMASAVNDYLRAGFSMVQGSAPATPAGLAISSITTSGAQGSWSSSATATSYTLRVRAGASLLASFQTSGTSVAITGLSASTTYTATVAASNSFGESAESSAVSFSTPSPAPTLPAPVASLTASPGVGSVTLTWPGASGATSYVVASGTVAGGPWGTEVSGVTSPYTVSNLTPGTAYRFVVYSVNSVGRAAASPESSAVPFAPTGGGPPPTPTPPPSPVPPPTPTPAPSPLPTPRMSTMGLSTNTAATFIEAPTMPSYSQQRKMAAAVADILGGGKLAPTLKQYRLGGGTCLLLIESGGGPPNVDQQIKLQAAVISLWGL